MMRVKEFVNCAATYYKVVVLMSGSPKACNRYLVKEWKVEIPDLIDSDCAGEAIECPFMDGSTMYVIWVNRFSEKAEHMGVLMHELYHITVKILKSVGIRYSDSSEESFAYMIQFLTEKSLTFFRKG
jgi:hypothetical protein